ncbi:hypothetical protein ACVWZM_002996 [Bradyrhizobium sp. USDA 4501]
MAGEDPGGLRAFLQRAETRLATMHAVAAAFIGGAGLLALFPVILRDAISTVLKVLIAQISAGSPVDMMWAFPFALILVIPIHSLYLLLQQLVELYFVPQARQTEEKFFPFLTIGAILPATDEPGHDLVLDDLLAKENLSIVMPGGEAAHSENIRLKHVRKTFPKMADSLPIENQPYPPSDNQPDLFRVAAGIASVELHSLSAQAARVIAILIKTNISVRVIVIRYAKALIVFVWSTLFIFLMNSITQSNEMLGEYRKGWLVILGLIWVAVTPTLTATPLRWLRRLGKPAGQSGLHSDAHFFQFEAAVYSACLVVALCILAMALIFSTALGAMATWEILVAFGSFAFLLRHGFNSGILPGSLERFLFRWRSS